MKKFKNEARKTASTNSNGCKRVGASRRSRKPTCHRSVTSAGVQGTNRARITEGRLSLCAKPQLLGGAHHSTSVTRQTTLPLGSTEMAHSSGDGPGVRRHSSYRHSSALHQRSSSIANRFEDARGPVVSSGQCDSVGDRSLDSEHADKRCRLLSPGECETPSAEPVFEVPVMEEFISTVNTAITGLLIDLTLSPRLASRPADPLAADQMSLARLWKQRCRADDQTGRYSRVALRLRPEVTTASQQVKQTTDLNNNNIRSDEVPVNTVSSPSRPECAPSVRAAVDSACEQDEQDFVLRLCSSSQASSQDALQLLRMCDEEVEEDSQGTGWSSCPTEFRPDPVGLMTRPCSRLSPAPAWSPIAPPAFWQQGSGDLLDSLESTSAVEHSCCSTTKQSSQSFFGSSFDSH